MSVFPVYPINTPIPLRDWLNMSADILGAPASLLHALILMTDKLLPITTTHMLDNRTKHSTRNAPCPRETSSSCLHSISRIPHFCNLRYYGIYSSKGQNSPHLLQALQKGIVIYLYTHTSEAHATRMYYSHWRGAYERAFGTDPLKCPCCGHTMGILFYEMNGKIVYSPPPRGSGCRARSTQTIEAICGA